MRMGEVFDRDVTAFRSDDPLRWTALIGIDLDGVYHEDLTPEKVEKLLGGLKK